MRRGQTESYSMIIGVVIAIVLFFIAGSVTYAAFSEEREARKNFEDFVEFFKELAESNGDFEGEKPLYVHRDHVIIGFSGDDIKPKGDCLGWIIGDDDKNLKIKKPEFCGSGGCLCLCDYGDSIVVDKKEIEERYVSIVLGSGNDGKNKADDSTKVDFPYGPPVSEESLESKTYSESKSFDDYIFSTKDICTGKKDLCLKEGIEDLSFSGEGNCGFFIPGIVRKNGKLVERGIDEIYLGKEKGNEAVVLESIIAKN